MTSPGERSDKTDRADAGVARPGRAKASTEPLSEPEPTAPHEPAQVPTAPGFGRLGDSVERFVRNLGGPPLTVLTQMEQRWSEIVGPALASTTRPIELVDGVLMIGCSDGSWASQVQWMEQQIIENFATVFSAEKPAGGRSDAASAALVTKVAVRVDSGR